MPTTVPLKIPVSTFQAQFHHRWHHLNDSHVRALAWLLDAPDLLDPAAPQWHGQIATLSNCNDRDTLAWLAQLDRAPQALHAYLNMQPLTRLGRYAEKLMAFYFQHQGTLISHGVQVRADKNDTVGEFDFLLRDGDALLHWEFATKYYLLESSGAGIEADYFVGPNLADTLGAKMRKILDRQLSLGLHPAAQIHLPQSIASAQALIKGWLFYHDDDPEPAQSLGVSKSHCRGFWCTFAELKNIDAQRYVVLPRLDWLAPAKIAPGLSVDKVTLQQRLATHFAHDTMPVMVAMLESQGGWEIEVDRGFVVPDDWRFRAGQRIHRAVAPPSK